MITLQRAEVFVNPLTNPRDNGVKRARQSRANEVFIDFTYRTPNGETEIIELERTGNGGITKEDYAKAKKLVLKKIYGRNATFPGIYWAQAWVNVPESDITKEDYAKLEKLVGEKIENE